jgi:opine dehydrogenase
MINGRFCPQFSNNIADAVHFSRTIIIILPSYGDDTIVEELRKYNDQLQEHIIIFVSGNWIARRASRDLRVRYILETATAPYACRYPDGTGSISGIKKVLPIACLPACPSQELKQTIGQLFPQPLDWRDNCFELGMLCITGIVHPAPILLNAQWIQDTMGSLQLYRQCMAKELDQDRIRIARAYGINVPSLLEIMNEYYGTQFADLKAFAMHSKAHAKILVGPEGLRGRGVIQDVPHVLVPWYQLGLKVGIASRPMQALIDLASRLNKEDYLRTGTTLEKLVLADLSPDDILKAYTRPHDGQSSGCVHFHIMVTMDSSTKQGAVSVACGSCTT